MVHTYGMSIMNKRTTFALDEETIQRLKKLAALWQVSQAEAVRRALKQAEEASSAKAEDHLMRLREYHEAGGLSAERAESYMHQVAEDRSQWGRRS